MDADKYLSTKVIVGDRVPRRGNWFTRRLAWLILRVLGWKPAGAPPNTEKFVISAAPHTSNWDGLYFLLAAFELGVDVNWIGKNTLFKGRWGPILRTMGGISIDRSKAQDVVAQTIEQFKQRASMVLVLAPEGTRNNAGKWKSGFYHMAHGAGVPISLGFCDYRTKRVGFGPSVITSGDFALDFEKMMAFYRQITPKFPDRYSLND